jgi:two-component sensor histidine kinase
MGATLSSDGLLNILPSDTRAFVGLAFYPRDQLGRVLRPTGFTAPHSLTLVSGEQSLTLEQGFIPKALERRETIRIGVPNTPLSLVLSVRSAPFTWAEILTMLVPLIMWLVAVLVAWIVFNRLVISPLAQLRANVANYQPGEILNPLRRMTIPAREIEELGGTFQTISQTVAAHEEELERGLARQTRLTREVHHRVKNNLQVVSSLINLHARASPSPEASAAYATISRRVDALAVVHRNHFAELEENRGVNLRSLIGELAANLRATATGDASRLAILIDISSIHVSQDTAIPIAFLVTELVELAMTIDPAAAIRISVVPTDEAGRACLIIASPAFRPSDRGRALLGERYGRVLEGLSRQLRSPLDRDGDAGSFKVCFSLIPEAPPSPEK